MVGMTAGAELVRRMEEEMMVDMPENVYLIYGAEGTGAEIAALLARQKEICARAKCHISRGGRPEDTPKCGKKIYVVDEDAAAAESLAESLNADVCLCCFGYGLDDENGMKRALEDAGIVIDAADPAGVPDIRFRDFANFREETAAV